MTAIKKATRIGRSSSLAAATSASSVVETYFRKIHAQTQVEKYREFTRWREAIGADLAEVTLPEKIHRNVLYVRVIDDVWAQELTLKKGEILRRLYAANAIPPVDDIIFVSGDPTKFSEA